MRRFHSILLLAVSFLCISGFQAPARILVMDHIVVALEPGTNAESCFGPAWPLARRLFGDWYTLNVEVASAEDIFAECDRWQLIPGVRDAEPDWIDEWWITPNFEWPLGVISIPFCPPFGPVIPIVPTVTVPLVSSEQSARLPRPSRTTSVLPHPRARKVSKGKLRGL
jgi:hypothetical protein